MVAVRQTPPSIGRVEVVDKVVGAVQHEAAPRLDRPADVDRQLTYLIGDAVIAIGSDDAETLEQIGEGDMRGALVDDEAHRPIFGVRAHVDHRACKARVGHHRHGNEKLAVEIAFSGCAARTGASDLHEVTLTRRLARCEAVN